VASTIFPTFPIPQTPLILCNMSNHHVRLALSDYATPPSLDVVQAILVLVTWKDPQDPTAGRLINRVGGDVSGGTLVEGADGFWSGRPTGGVDGKGVGFACAFIDERDLSRGKS
jgi:hypothetical protein